MENENMTVDTANTSAAPIPTTQDNPPALVKKIGKMTYIVRIHFSETSTETMEDKRKRQIVRYMVRRKTGSRSFTQALHGRVPGQAGFYGSPGGQAVYSHHS